MALNLSLPEPLLSREVLEMRRFYLDLQADTTETFGVICGGWEKCTPDYCVRRDDFPYFCVEFVAAGKGLLELLGKSYVLCQGTIFAYGPGCPHVIRTDPADVLSKYFIDFVGSDALSFMESASLMPGLCRQIPNTEEVQAAFEQVMINARRMRKFSSRIAALEVQTLLLKIADAVPPQVENYQSHQTFLKCRAYIDEHFLEVSTAMEVASKCHVGAEYLSRLFTRYGNETVYRYLSRKKMSHAAELLDSGHYNVNEAADKLGIDPFHFSRKFKRVFGLSPSLFLGRRVTQFRLPR